MDANYIESFQKQYPEAYKIACAVSISPKVELELLRKVRFELFPKIDAGIEADIWFCPLVQTRTPVTIVFFPEALEKLRNDLASDQEFLTRVWDILERFHKYITPVLRLEEEIIHLALLDKDNGNEIENKLKSVLVAIVQEKRVGLSQWAFRALPQLPLKAKTSGTALILAVIAGTQQGQTIQLGPLPHTINWENLSWAIPKDISKVSIGVRLTNTSIEFGDTDLSQANVIEIPKTNPLLLEVSWDAGQNPQTHVVSWEIGQSCSIEGWNGAVQVRTLLGETYLVSSLLSRWNEIQESLYKLYNDVEFKQLDLLLERVLESFNLGLWKTSIYEAFISLISDLAKDLNRGQTLQEILSKVLSNGFNPSPHWEKNEAYILQPNIFFQTLTDVLESLKTSENQVNLTSKFTLTMLRASNTENYIFASSNFQEIIGASELVYRATNFWIFDALDKVQASHNIERQNHVDWIYSNATIETNDRLQAEVVRIIGGNIFILFKEKEKARKFVQALTLRLLKDAPGLKILAQHLDDFDLSKHKLSEAFQVLTNKMRQYEFSRQISLPTLGLGVTAMCNSTGLPAVTTLGGSLLVEGKVELVGMQNEDKVMLVSSTTAVKLAWRNQARHRMNVWLKQVLGVFEFPYDIDRMGRVKQREEGHVAIVSVIVNSLSWHFENIAQNIEKNLSAQDISIANRKYIDQIRKFSQHINDISMAALQSVVALTVQVSKNNGISYSADKGSPILPLRPIVFGEQGVTFVCSGTIGVELAAKYLEVFEIESRKRGLDFCACAGVTIFNPYYPFALAYKLSEDLLRQSQNFVHQKGEDCSVLDWHFAKSGLNGQLVSIRKREYAVRAGRMNVRPLTLNDWRSVEIVIESFKDSYWQGKHSNVIGLRDALRKGPDAARKYIQEYDLPRLPEIAGEEAQDTGWLDGVCQYFDALELLDYHTSLNKKEVA